MCIKKNGQNEDITKISIDEMILLLIGIGIFRQIFQIYGSKVLIRLKVEIIWVL